MTGSAGKNGERAEDRREGDGTGRANRQHRDGETVLRDRVQPGPGWVFAASVTVRDDASAASENATDKGEDKREPLHGVSVSAVHRFSSQAGLASFQPTPFPSSVVLPGNRIPTGYGIVLPDAPAVRGE